MGNVYLPILILGLLAGAFAIFSVGIASVTGPKRYNRAKVDAYECGIEPSPQPPEPPDGAEALLPGTAWPANHHAPFTIRRTPRTRWLN